MAIRDADIKLLFGVATGGADGDSAALIQQQLKDIMSKIKVGVTLNTSNFHAQINKGIKEVNAKGDFSVKISEIKIGQGAISAFKKKLSDVINTLNLDKGVSVTLSSKEIGKIAGDTKEIKRQTEAAAKAAAEYKVQMTELDERSKNIKNNLKSAGGVATASEQTDIAAIRAQYDAWLVKMETAREMGIGWDPSQRAAIIDEATAIQNNIQALLSQQEARVRDTKAAEAEAAASEAAAKAAEAEAAAAEAAAKSKKKADEDRAARAKKAKDDAHYETVRGNLRSNINSEFSSAKQSFKNAVGLTEGQINYQTSSIADIQARYDAWTESIKELNKLGKNGSAERRQEIIAEGQAIQTIIAKLREYQQLNNNNAAKASLTDVEKAYQKINAYITKNKRVSGSDLEQLQLMRDKLSDILKSAKKTSKSFTDMDKDALRKLLSDFDILDKKITIAGKKGKTFAGIIASAYEKFGGWMLVTKSLTAAVRSLRAMWENVKNLDTAMTELKKVTNETADTYERFFDTASARAKQLGTTISDTINATADFARLGYSISDASELADAALVYKNVGDGIEDISESSESIISTMKAFGIEAKNAMLIVDKFNEVGNNFAISSKGVGDALMNSASALQSANNSLDESIALVTAANSTIQDPEKVGTALKTISMYLRAAKTEAEEAGESTDGMANSVSELRTEILRLTGNRVDIMFADGKTFKSTYEIMKDLSKVWSSLSDVTQANILEQIGGKRNSNVVTSLLKNFNVAEKVLETTSNAAGSALSENEKYLDSISGRISQFKAAVEDLSAAVINSDVAKTVVDGATDIIGAINGTVDALGALPPLISTVISAFTAINSAKGNNFGLFDVIDGHIGLNTGLKTGVDVLSKFGEYNRLIDAADEAQLKFVSSLDETDKNMAAYLKTLNGGKASIKGYRAYCREAGVEVKGLGNSSRLAAAGVGILNTALNAIGGMLVGLAIQLIVSAIQNLVTASERAIEKTKELNEAFASFKKTNADNIQTLESMRGEFERLSVGVSRYGTNVTLTADEYERYKEIVQEVIAISPALSSGYDQENGYLADKNELIERAIELQEQEYQAELRKMALTSNMSERMKGYAADYNDSQVTLNNADQRLTPAIFKMVNYDKDHTAVRAVMEALGVENIDSELEKYVLQGNVQWGRFWSEYSDVIVDNFDKVAASLNYEDLGFESEELFDRAVQSARDAAEKYAQARSEIASINKDIANDLQYSAQANDAYRGLNAESKQLVADFVDSFGIDDVFKKTLSGDYVQDDTLINQAKSRIGDFISKLTPEVQGAISGMFQIQDLFESGDVGARAYQETIDQILADLKNAGFDDETVKQLKLSLDIDSVETQLTTVKNAITDLSEESSDAVDEMSSEDLRFAYEIIAKDGSMTFDELRAKIQQARLENADMVDVLDFSEMISGLDEAKNGLDAIISAMDKLNSGTALAKEELASLALQYPKLLEQADLFVDGSIDGQKRLLDTILAAREAEYDAEIDTKIAELKVAEQVINDQLDLEEKKEDLINEIKNLSVNGQVEQQDALVQKISELNDLQGQNYVSMEEGTLKVNEEALKQKGQQEADYGQSAATNIWAPYANTIKKAHTEGFGKGLEALKNYDTKLPSWISRIASKFSILGGAIADATTGKWKGIGYYWNKLFDSTGGDFGVDAGDVTVTFDGGTAYVGDTHITEWVSEQEKYQKQRIDAVHDLMDRTVTARENLEKLRGLDLTSIYGSAGKGSSSSSKKTVEEYIADIDKYYEAVKRLEAAQERSNSLSKKIKYTEDTAEKIKLSSALIDAYREEADAEKNLMSLKRQTIADNAAALRALGFDVEYNSEANELLIKNQEHLNDLTASSAGKYSTLQEATNALRKETEALINATEQLNDDNVNAASSIEDLGYSIQDTKNSIVDYIEDVYGKQVDAYQEVINKRKELISSAKDELSYEEDVAEKVKEIAELQARIDQLALDDSRSARAERNTLMDELKEKQKNLADTQRDHSVDTQTDALDKMADDYESEKNAELELIRKTVNESDKLWSAFYNTLLGKNVTVGESINENIANAWINAARAVNEYSASVQSIGGVGTVVSNIPKYHDGGVVSEANLGKDEALAILQKGEIVLNEQKQESLYRIIDFQEELSKRLGVVIGELRPALPSIDMSGLINRITYEPNTSPGGMIFEPRIEVNISHSGDMDMSQAQAYGDKIASVAIDKLYSAFERRGISSSRGARLKP